MLRFYQTLDAGLRAHGWTCHMQPLDRGTLQTTVDASDAFHIVNHGRLTHHRVLNAGIAYVYPFWNLDPKGIRAFSSIADLPFRPGSIDADVARPFFRQLRSRLVGQRKSRYAQPDAIAQVPQGCVAVFLQAKGLRDLDETCYLTRTQMLDTVLVSAQGPVVVKPHPEDDDPGTRSWLRGLAEKFPQLHVCDGNIHDILAAADRVVTINSAVGIEAYLHRKTVILCGRCDFHHIADVARTQHDLAGFLQTTRRARAYDKFIWWYFGQMCLSATDPDLVGKALARMT